jgi:hypothetical protein
MPAAHNRVWVLPFVFLVLASLACQTVYRVITIPDPEGLATDVVPFYPATSTPRPKTTPTPGPSPTPQPTPAADLTDLAQFEAAMRPEFAGDVDLFASATRYVIDVTVSFDGDRSATLTGGERIRYTNTQAFPLDEIYLMLWPNHDDQYFSALTMTDVRLNGQPVEPVYEHGDLAARIDLPAPLAPGASAEISAAFSIEASAGIAESGAARFGLTNGVLLAPTFYPLIPRILDDGRWQTEPAPPGGDTTNSDTALYLWRVTAPAEMSIIGSGTVIHSEASGAAQTQTLVSGPMRDLALVVGPLQKSQRTVDGIALNAYMLAQNAEYADEMLDYVEGQIRTLQDKIGPYPFAELDMVDAPGAFGGIEYPGVIFIGVVGPDDFFEIATVHEVGHQWFYSVVGDDQLREPWLDEAAATYTEVLYFESVKGSARQILDEFRSYLENASGADRPIGLPVSEYDDDYALVVYIKGALFFDALRQELGDQVFFQFLRNYYAAERYGFASTVEFQAEAESTCACDLDALFNLWVYEGGAVPGP